MRLFILIGANFAYLQQCQAQPATSNQLKAIKHKQQAQKRKEKC